MKIVFATNNRHKLEEITRLLSDRHEIVSLEAIGCRDEIPEDHDTLEDNARQKAHYIKDHYGYNCFADDTGLEIAALDGRPGVYSARYAGLSKESEANMDKVLSEMTGIENRRAQFRTVIALIIDGQEYLFEGIVTGEILNERHGKEGFGYDPIFRPDGYQESFAEMALDDKNRISHRGKAVEKLAAFLQS